MSDGQPMWLSGGIQAYQDYSQSKQLFDLSMQEGQQKILEGGMKLEEEQMTLQGLKTAQDLQKKVSAEMQKLSSTPGQPGESPENKLINDAYHMADFYASQGYPEKALEIGEKAVDVESKQAKIEEQKSQDMKDTAEWVGGHIGAVTDERSWQSFKLLSQSELKKPLDPKLVQMSFAELQSSGMLDTIKQNIPRQKEAADLALQQAKTKAELAAANSAKFDDAYKQAETALRRTQAANLAKVGGKAPPDMEWDLTKDVPTLKVIPGSKTDMKEKAKEAQGDASLQVAETQIDDLLGILQEHKAVTGGAGMVRRAGEWVVDTFGGNATAATEFADKMHALQAQAPQLLELGKKLGVDQRKLLESSISGLQTMTSHAQAVQKLKDFKRTLEIIHGKGADTEKVEDTKTIGGKTYVKRGGQWYEQ
jgi:hypothetical protein